MNYFAKAVTKFVCFACVLKQTHILKRKVQLFVVSAYGGTFGRICETNLQKIVFALINNS